MYLAATAMVVLGVHAFNSTVSANVLTNPGFETDDASAGDVAGATGWSGFNSSFTTRSVVPHSGLQDLKVFGPFFVGGGAGVVQGGFAATPGQAWTASSWLRDDSSDAMQGTNFAVVQLQFLDSTNTVLSTFESPHFTAADPVNTWEQETANGAAPAGTTSAQIVLVHVQINNPVTGGSVFWDDASLAVAPEPGSLALLGIGGGLLAMRRRKARIA
jgi:hypothetical protein